MNKNTYFNPSDHFSPEQHLKQLSLLEDEDGLNGKTFGFSHKYVKKISIIDGWVKAKDKQAEVNTETKTNFQDYRKLIRPNISTARSHYSHIAFTPRPMNINQPQTQGLIFHHIKRRPMSSTIVRHDYFDHSQTQLQPAASRQKTHHEYLKKNCGIRNSKKSLEKDNKKKTIESSIYPIFEPTHFQNPQKLIPNIGRISYLVKLKKRYSMESKM